MGNTFGGHAGPGSYRGEATESPVVRDTITTEPKKGAERYNGTPHVGLESEQFGVNQEAESREGTGRPTEVLEPDIEIRQRRRVPSTLMERPNLNLSLITVSPDSAYGTQTVLRSRPFEPDMIAISPTESTLSQTSKYMTPTECRSVPSTMKKVRIDSDDESKHRSNLRVSSSIRNQRRKAQEYDDQKRRLTESSSSDSEETACASSSWQPKKDQKIRKNGLRQKQTHSAEARCDNQKSELVKKSNLFSNRDTSSSDDDEYIQASRPRHILKPPKYDGTTPFETFWAQFQNCCSYNRWTKTEQLVYLRGSLEKEAGQVLWDYSTEVTNSLKKLTVTLKERFGGTNQADKFRMEVRHRRRKNGETLQSLHSDIRRLAALAFPELDHKARESIACDYFIDALDDPDFALKVRERSPANLDSALRIALQLEVWIKGVDRIRNEQPRVTEKKTREVTQTESMIKTNEALRKQVAELQDQLAKAAIDRQTFSSAEDAAAKPVESATRHNRTSSNKPNMTSQRRDFACWGCGDPAHTLRYCPNKTYEEKDPIRKSKAPWQVRPIQEKQARTCITVGYKKRRINTLIDTGSDITLTGTDTVKKYRWKIRPCELTSVKVANGEPMIITGIVKKYLSVGNKDVMSNIYISPDITGLIIGIDWLEQQGKFEWDFQKQRIRFDNGEWIELQNETEHGCRRIYVENDVVLPPRQETVVPVRVSHRSRTLCGNHRKPENTELESRIQRTKHHSC